MATRHRFRLGDRLHNVVVDEAGGLLRIAIDDEEPVLIDAAASGVPGLVSMIVDDHPRRAYVSREGTGFRVLVEGREFAVAPAVGGRRGHGAVGAAADPPGTVSAPLAGVVVEIRVSVGDEVSEGQGLVVIEAMKMQNEIQAPRAGTITAIHCTAAGRVEKGDLVIEYEVAEDASAD